MQRLRRIGVAATAANRPMAFSTPPISEDEADEKKVRKRQACERNRQIELGRIIGKAWRKPVHQPWHGDLHRRDEREQRPQQNAQRLLGEGAGRTGALLLQEGGEQRHKAGVEGAFGEQATEEVRQLEGDEERIGHRPGPERKGDQYVASEAEQAGLPSYSRQQWWRHAGGSRDGLKRPRCQRPRARGRGADRRARRDRRYLGSTTARRALRAAGGGGDQASPHASPSGRTGL